MAKKKKKKVSNKKKVNNKKKKKTSSVKRKNTTAKVSKNVSNKSNSKKLTKESSDKTLKKENKKQPSKTIDVEVKNTKEKKLSKTVDNKAKNDNDKKTIKISKKIIVVLFVLTALVILLVLFLNKNINKSNTNSGIQKITFDEYLDLYEKDDLEFIYLYHPNCINCNSYEDKLMDLEKEFEIKINKFDYSKLNKSDYDILKSSNSFLEDGIDIPMIISIKKGNEIGSISGIKEYSALKNFVSLSKNENGTNKFSKIDVDDYLSILNSKEKSLIFICDSTSVCSTFSNVLDNVSSSRKIEVKYLNTENITSSDDWEKLESSNKIFKDMWFMPTILIVKDGKVIAHKMETLTEKDLNSFLKKNGM